MVFAFLELGLEKAVATNHVFDLRTPMIDARMSAGNHIRSTRTIYSCSSAVEVKVTGKVEGKSN